MTVKRALAAVLIALATAPAAAAAPVPVAPPKGDNYLDAVLVNDETALFKAGDSVSFTAKTGAYTTQVDLFNPDGDGKPSSGGPSEPNKCGTAVYGRTVWSDFYIRGYGKMTITTSASFNSVIGVVPFKNLDDAAPDIDAGLCYDGLKGSKEDATFLVGPRRWYAVQVGGVGSSGGDVRVDFDLKKPPTVGGRALLSWKRRPLRIADLHLISVPKGQKVALSCTNGSCASKTIAVRARVVARALGGDLGSGPFTRTTMRRAARVAVQEAKARVQVLKNQRVKAKSKIELRITRPGYIGKYYAWTVSKNSISAPAVLCLNPGSSKPRSVCAG